MLLLLGWKIHSILWKLQNRLYWRLSGRQALKLAAEYSWTAECKRCGDGKTIKKFNYELWLEKKADKSWHQGQELRKECFETIDCPFCTET